MKQKITLAVLAFFALTAMAFTINTHTPSGDKHTANNVVSAIHWKGYKVTGEHEGTIELKSGAFDFEDNKLVGGSFIMDMNTISCTDLEGGGAKKLEGHLKSDDFFGVKKFPTASFKITKVTMAKSAGNYNMTGDLSIKGKTKSIKFPAKIETKDGEYVAYANLKINRTDFNIRYGSGSFFDNLGDKAISDNFDLDIIIVTK